MNNCFKKILKIKTLIIDLIDKMFDYFIYELIDIFFNFFSKKVIFLKNKMSDSDSRKGLICHFTTVSGKVPFDTFPDPPFPSKICGWMKYNDAFLAITEDGVQTSHFYCPVHTKWLKVKDNSFYYVERHLSINSGYAKMFRRSKTNAISTIVNQNKQITFSQEQKKFIEKAIISYILMTNKPLNDGDNEFLKQILPTLSPAILSNKAGEVADSVRLEMKAILSRSKYIRPSIDEWEDASKNRYIGETIYTIWQGQWKQFVVALRKIESEHATSQEIVNILSQIEQDYSIDPQNERFCTDNCNTMKGVQNKKVDMYRFPCIIHLIHNIAKHFLKMEPVFKKSLKALVKSLHKSCNFASYCNKHHINKIPTFTEVRWYSISKTLSYLDQNRHHIITYLQQQQPNNVPDESFWNSVAQNKTFFQQIYKCVEILEGDSFGTISRVNAVFVKITNEINKIVKITNEINKITDDLSDCKKHVIEYFQQFQKDYENELFPLIYVAEFLNPQLCLQLNHDQIEQVTKYIADHAEKLGFPIPSDYQRSSQNEESIIPYTDELQENCDLLNELKNSQTRKLGRDQDLLSFWTSKLNNQYTKGISMVALDVLSTLCNSASVEREFSRAKNILTMKRLRLLPLLKIY